jgi:5-methylcytosine-specific restriction endonuclease McrA
MMSTLFVSRRIKLEDSERQAILVRQERQCAICGDELKKRFDVDHIVPLCQGGTNDASNLRALCQPCHAEETYKLQQAGTDLSEKSKFHTIESHLSPQLYRDLHCAPKPKEVSYGVFESSKELSLIHI